MFRENQHKILCRKGAIIAQVNSAGNGRRKGDRLFGGADVIEEIVDDLIREHVGIHIEEEIVQA